MFFVLVKLMLFVILCAMKIQFKIAFNVFCAYLHYGQISCFSFWWNCCFFAALCAMKIEFKIAFNEASCFCTYSEDPNSNYCCTIYYTRSYVVRGIYILGKKKHVTRLSLTKKFVNHRSQFDSQIHGRGNMTNSSRVSLTRLG